MNVLVIGGLNLDTLARISADPKPATSNPGTTRRLPGGVGRNIAENLARLGSPVSLVGAVGRDVAGDLLLERLVGAGVDATHVRRSDHPTGTYTAVLDPSGELLIGVADMTATDSVLPRDIDAGLIASATWLVIDGNLPIAVTAHCLELARGSGTPVVLDPVGVAKSARLGALDRLDVHTFTPTVDELFACTGLDDVGSAAARVHDLGVEVLWLRRGAEGSLLWRRGEAATTVSLPPPEVVDVTGAGDAMLAAYVHLLGAGHTVERAARFGAAAAWLTVGSPMPVRPDLSADLVRRTLTALDNEEAP